MQPPSVSRSCWSGADQNAYVFTFFVTFKCEYILPSGVSLWNFRVSYGGHSSLHKQIGQSLLDIRSSHILYPSKIRQEQERHALFLPPSSILCTEDELGTRMRINLILCTHHLRAMLRRRLSLMDWVWTGYISTSTDSKNA